jgi:hypothetical protein
MKETTGHELVATTAFELVGVALLAILADTSKAIGNVVLVFMVAVGFIWLMTSGAGFLQGIMSHVPSTK